MECWGMSLGILRQLLMPKSRAGEASKEMLLCNSAHNLFQYLCVIHFGSFLCGVLPREE